MSEEQKNLLAMIKKAVETDRDSLVENLNEAKNQQQIAIRNLRQIANSWAIKNSQGIDNVKNYVGKIEDLKTEIELIEQTLSMHDDPQHWREYVGDLLQPQIEENEFVHLLP